MKIVVCVKQVPDTETRIRIAPEGNALLESDINWIVSPYDEFAIEEALKQNRVTYAAYMYEGANHGFHNDTTPRYDEAAAKLAWQRTLTWFAQYLKA